MRKHLALALSAAMLAGLISGCAPSASNPTPAPASPGATQPAGQTGDTKDLVEVEFWNSAEGNVGIALNARVDEFNATVGAEKGIHVNAVFQGTDVMEKLKTLAQAKDFVHFPDVGQIYSAGIPALVGLDVTLPVDDIYSAGTYDISVAKEDIVPNFARTYTYAGKLISMPLNSSSLLLYYNKDAAREAGLDAEAPPKTMAELADWTDKLTVRDGNTVTRYGLNIQIDRYELVNFLVGISPTGCNFIGDNEGGRADMMTRLTIGEDGSLRKFLTEWQKVIDTGGFKPVNDNEKEEFAAGVSAMNFQSTSQLQTMIALAEGKFELGVAPLPRCTEEDNFGASVGGGSLTMFDSGDPAKVAATWEFVQYMASPETQLAFSLDTGYLPVNEKTYELPDWLQHLEEEPLAKVAVDQMRISDPGMQEPFDIINWELNSLVQSNMIDFADGKIDLDTCEKNIVDGFDAKLAEYIRANT